MELTASQINVIEILTESEGLDFDIARKIAIETNGDLSKARIVGSDYKLHESHKSKGEM
ncbi:hypothetical protein ACTHPJ_24060 [Paenibacillus amylolyticus]|uniref:hypothetical protein n=1 Tax=Paenibacillus amylolyticus TaxID=1451 RepID=UPI003F81210F